MAKVYSSKRQGRLLKAIEKAHEPKIAGELARAYMAYVRAWEETGLVVYDPDHERNIGVIMDGMASLSVRVMAAEVDRMLKRAERKDFSDFLAKLAFRYISQEAYRRRITAISDTTRQQVIEAVEQGFADGLGQGGIGQYVRAKVPEFSRARANMIARTETHGAANYGAIGAANETGLTLRKVWIAAEDARTRPEHAAMNDVRVDMDQVFDFGEYSLGYPGDPSGPPEGVINCRCSLGFEPVE